PIKMPPARGDVAPSLALSYSSAGGAGVAGFGWSLSVPFIARQTDKGVPRYKDGAAGAFSSDQDRFVFGGGQELVPICVIEAGACPVAVGETMPAWATGWMYFRARVEGAYLRFFWSPDRKTWRVLDKAGNGMELGVPLDGTGDPNALEADPALPARIFRWNLARQYDVNDAAAVNTGSTATPKPVNPVVYRYATVEGTAYLTDVFDTPPASNASGSATSAFAHHVSIAYESRPDTSFSFRRRYRAADTQRVARVDVTSKGADAVSGRALVRRYHLGYEDGLTVSRLQSVTVEGRCATEVAETASGALPASSCPSSRMSSEGASGRKTRATRPTPFRRPRSRTAPPP
ncbi:hypothetical protein EON77_19625, partial [bacterium]